MTNGPQTGFRLRLFTEAASAPTSRCGLNDLSRNDFWSLKLGHSLGFGHLNIGHSLPQKKRLRKARQSLVPRVAGGERLRRPGRRVASGSRARRMRHRAARSSRLRSAANPRPRRRNPRSAKPRSALPPGKSAAGTLGVRSKDFAPRSPTKNSQTADASERPPSSADSGGVFSRHVKRALSRSGGTGFEPATARKAFWCSAHELTTRKPPSLKPVRGTPPCQPPKRDRERRRPGGFVASNVVELFKLPLRRASDGVEQTQPPKVHRKPPRLIGIDRTNENRHSGSDGMFDV